MCLLAIYISSLEKGFFFSFGKKIFFGKKKIFFSLENKRYFSFFSLEKRRYTSSLFRSSAHFLTEIFVFFMLSCMHSLYILNINPLPDISLANIFSHSVGSLFVLLILSFVVQKFLAWCSPISFIFAFVSPLLRIHTQKNIAKTDVKKKSTASFHLGILSHTI